MFGMFISINILTVQGVILGKFVILERKQVWSLTFIHVLAVFLQNMFR